VSELWICFRWEGRYLDDGEWFSSPDDQPQFQGVFSSRDRAVAACRDYSYCIWPVVLNEELPHEPCPTPNVEWPNPDPPPP
jgi:hypothetical protein